MSKPLHAKEFVAAIRAAIKNPNPKHNPQIHFFVRESDRNADAFVIHSINTYSASVGHMLPDDDSIVIVNLCSINSLPEPEPND